MSFSGGATTRFDRADTTNRLSPPMIIDEGSCDEPLGIWKGLVAEPSSPRVLSLPFDGRMSAGGSRTGDPQGQ